MAKPERTGVARYCQALVHALPPALGPQDRVTLLYRISRLRRRRWFERVEDARFRAGLFDDRLPLLRLRGFDVVHGPDLRVPRVRGVPTVSTVHDLSALDVPGIAGEDFRRRKQEALREVAQRAAAILCISGFTERAFLGRHPEARGRTRVVPLGLSAIFREQDPEEVARVRAERGLAARYVLFVGQIAARKNLGPLVEAFSALRARPENRDLELVLVGPVQTGGQELLDRFTASPAAAAVRRLGFVEDTELPPLYAGAEAFVFPGKGEGFGLPLLEAMACGCPVVAARAAAIPETAGDAALLFAPDSAAELEHALARALEPGPSREALVARGLARAARFSWAETARLTVEAYHDAVRVGVPA